MFKKDQIDLIYRVICLVAFIMVILFDNSLITLIGLEFVFFLLTYKEEKAFYVALYLFSFIFSCLGYVAANYGLIKFILIIDYIVYYLNIPSLNILVKKTIDYYANNKKERDIKEESEEISENEYYRFKTNNNLKRHLSLQETFYITIHLILLFISILVG